MPNKNNCYVLKFYNIKKIKKKIILCKKKKIMINLKRGKSFEKKR